MPTVGDSLRGSGSPAESEKQTDFRRSLGRSDRQPDRQTDTRADAQTDKRPSSPGRRDKEWINDKQRSKLARGRRKFLRLNDVDDDGRKTQVVRLRLVWLLAGSVGPSVARSVGQSNLSPR